MLKSIALTSFILVSAGTAPLLKAVTTPASATAAKFPFIGYTSRDPVALPPKGWKRVPGDGLDHFTGDTDAPVIYENGREMVVTTWRNAPGAKGSGKYLFQIKEFITLKLGPGSEQQWWSCEYKQTGRFSLIGLADRKTGRVRAVFGDRGFLELLEWKDFHPNCETTEE